MANGGRLKPFLSHGGTEKAFLIQGASPISTEPREVILNLACWLGLEAFRVRLCGSNSWVELGMVGGGLLSRVITCNNEF